MTLKRLISTVLVLTLIFMPVLGLTGTVWAAADFEVEIGKEKQIFFNTSGDIYTWIESGSGVYQIISASEHSCIIRGLSVGTSWISCRVGKYSVVYGYVYTTYDFSVEVTQVKQTEPVITNPSVSFVSPANNAVDVSVNASIRVRFDTSVSRGDSFDDIALSTDSRDVPFDSALSGAVLTITPTDGFVNNAEYSLNIPRGAVEHSSGGTLRSNYSTKFKTLPFEAISDNAGNNMPTTSELRVNFNVPISFGSGNITIRDNLLNKDVTLTTRIEDKTLVLTPKLRLRSSGSYEIKLPADSIIGAGVTMHKQWFCGFTTAEERNVKITSQSFKLNKEDIEINAAVSVTNAEEVYFLVALYDSGVMLSQTLERKQMASGTHEIKYKLAIPKEQRTSLTAKIGIADKDLRPYALADDDMTLNNTVTLSSVSVNGAPLSGFLPANRDYVFTFKEGDPLPTITDAVTSHSFSDYVIVQAPDIDTPAKIIVTAQSGEQSVYTVKFSYGTAVKPVFITDNTPMENLDTGTEHTIFIRNDSMLMSVETETNGAIVHYTTDGTTPTAESPVWTAPVPLDRDMTIKAVARKHGYFDSTVETLKVGTFVGVDKVEFAYEAAAGDSGMAGPLSYTITPENAYYKDVTFSSGNTEIAYFQDSASSLLSLKYSGEAKIRVTTNEGARTDELDLTVYPIYINTAEDFAAANFDRVAEFVLGGDIEVPASASEKNLGGIFDGNGYTISGITEPLFNEVRQGAVVRNLQAESGGTCSDGIIARTNLGTIEQCVTRGSVSGMNAGGIACYNSGIIRDCYSTADVTSGSRNATYPNSAGGISASTEAGNASVLRCYSTGEISAAVNTTNFSDWQSSVWATGISTNHVDKCVALNERIYITTRYNSYINEDLCLPFGRCTAGVENSALYELFGEYNENTTKRLTAEELKTRAPYEELGWDFDKIWTISNSYPTLKMEGVRSVIYHGPPDAEFAQSVPLRAVTQSAFTAITAAQNDISVETSVQKEGELKINISLSPDINEDLVSLAVIKKGEAVEDAIYFNLLRRSEILPDGSIDCVIPFYGDIDEYRIVVGVLGLPAFDTEVPTSDSGLCAVSINSDNLKAENNTLSGSLGVTISSGSDSPIEAAVFIAIYDKDGKMVYCASQNDAWINRGNNLFEFENILIPYATAQKYAIKAFAWRSAESMIPVSDSRTISLRVIS